MSNGFTKNEQNRFSYIKRTFEDNFKITRLYAAYLEHFPEIITAELVSSVYTEGGSVSREGAIAALVAELLGVAEYNTAEDRRFFRDYILPSVRILDAEKYRRDPYYKNIRIPNVTDGDWELRTEAYEPYRAVICHDMVFGENFLEIPPLGFFEEKFEFPAVLEGGNEWMTLTPVDLDTCEEAINAARGRVITFGLGLGYYAYMASEKASVESVTVIEKSPKVIELFKKYILPQFPNRDKIEIIEADAFEYAKADMPKREFDVAFVDTWRDASDGAPMYRRMKPLESLSPKTEFHYWIENFLISRLRAIKFAKILDKYEEGCLSLSFDEVIRQLSDPMQLIAE